MTRLARISLYGDSEIAREGLKRLLGEGGFKATCRPLLEIGNLDQAFDDLDEHVILIDARSAEAALSACETLRTHFGNARIVVIGDGCDSAMVRRTLTAGANGYV